MDINEVIVWILMICMVLGGINRAIGNKFGLGEHFEEGFNALGPLALAMVGVMSLSPVLAKIVSPVISPLYGLIGADPAMFAGTLLANDMGGWPLAQQMTDNLEAAQLSGLILGAMMARPSSSPSRWHSASSTRRTGRSWPRASSPASAPSCSASWSVAWRRASTPASS